MTDREALKRTQFIFLTIRFDHINLCAELSARSDSMTKPSDDSLNFLKKKNIKAEENNLLLLRYLRLTKSANQTSLPVG